MTKKEAEEIVKQRLKRPNFSWNEFWEAYGFLSGWKAHEEYMVLPIKKTG